MSYGRTSGKAELDRSYQEGERMGRGEPTDNKNELLKIRFRISKHIYYS
jgi:hypothetical protein